MSEGYEALTGKEKEALRLIVRGHDAKSTARHLGLSVHTVNERLRDARRKLSVSSSREAARLLLEKEGGPDFLTDRPLGDARPASGVTPGLSRKATRGFAWLTGGALSMSLFLAALAVTALSQNASAPRPAVPSATVDAATAAQTTRTAGAWLALVDQGRWNDSWTASGEQFRQSITRGSWNALIESVRRPLGAVRSRTTLNRARVAAARRSYVVVKFRTSFANKPAAIETVSLEREGNEWRVVGYWIA